MINREVYLKNIVDSLALLSKQVSMRGSINLYDINIISETFYAGLVNCIEGCNLINANTIEKNATGIDLTDEKNRVSVQVTSDNTSSKSNIHWKNFAEESYIKNMIV